MFVAKVFGACYFPINRLEVKSRYLLEWCHLSVIMEPFLLDSISGQGKQTWVSLALRRGTAASRLWVPSSERESGSIWGHLLWAGSFYSQQRSSDNPPSPWRSELHFTLDEKKAE